VTAGPAPVACQWQKNGVYLADGGNISGAALATLTISNITTADAAGYTAVLANTIGSVTSLVATLTVLVPPTILVPPQSQTVPVGADVTLSVTAAGTAPLGYRWQFNGADLGGTFSTYLLGNVHTNKTGNYTVIVSNAVATATSAVATVTVLNPPAIVTPPTSLTVTQGAGAAFTVTATGSEPLSYQWQKNGTNLTDGGHVTGSGTTNLSLSSVSASDAGSYAVVVANGAGSAATVGATLTVVMCQPPLFDSIGLLPDGSVQLGMSGGLGCCWILECTSNLVDWVVLTNFSSGGPFPYHDSVAISQSRRFYRLRLCP